MKISSVNVNSQSFKGALVNINAFSDTHGELQNTNCALEELKKRRQDIFCSEKKGAKNVLAICGDWFMDGARKGYISNPDKPNGKFQLDMLNQFINEIKKLAGNIQVLFTPGNHEFDGGVNLLNDIITDMNARTIITNLDLKKSPAFETNIKKDKIVNEEIIEVEDDKNPEIKHKILFLGITPVNLQAYQKDTNGITLKDNSAKSQKDVTEEDYEKTMQDCIKRIKSFKKQNPKGIVVIMSHTGVNFSDNLAKQAPVDIVFDGHEHKEDIRISNKTPIIPLSQNFNKIINIKIDINDDGTLKNITIKPFSPKENKTIGPLYGYYKKLFREDVTKRYSIITDKNGIKILDTENIRKENNYLANFITDAILEELQKTDKTIDFFALNSSAMRHPLNVSEKASISYLDIMNTLSGIKEEDGKILTTELNGLEITYLVLDNLLFNKDFPQKNPLIHYAGLCVDKTGMLNAYQKGEKIDSLAKYVTVIKTNQSIDTKKKYKIANVEKYFNKSQNPNIKKLKNKSEYMGLEIHELFKNHFLSTKMPLKAKCDIRIS